MTIDWQVCKPITSDLKHSLEEVNDEAQFACPEEKENDEQADNEVAASFDYETDIFNQRIQMGQECSGESLLMCHICFGLQHPIQAV